MTNIAFGIFFGFILILSISQAETVKYKYSYFKRFDDTDNIKEKKISKLNLYIDYGTGCHYLKSGIFGGLTPRLDKEGRQVCEYQQQEIKEQIEKVN